MNEEVKTQAVAEQEVKPVVICTAAFFVEGSDKPVTVSGDNADTLLNIISSVTQSIVPFVQLAQNGALYDFSQVGDNEEKDFGRIPCREK